MYSKAEYDLSRLTEFNPALVYAFEPEINNDANTLRESLFTATGQHQDTLAAYLYAQDTLLPTIRFAGLQAISHTQWIQFIKTIHQHIGYHLLSNLGYESGKYTQDAFMFRWHPGCSIVDAISYYLSTSDFSRKSIMQFCQKLEMDYHAPSADFRDLITIIIKISKDPSVQLAANRQPNLPESEKKKKGIIMLFKLHTAYYTGKLSEDEKRRVNKIVKLPMPAEQIPNAMVTFIAHLIDDLQTLDYQNIDAVSEFLATYFYGLVDIHPFPNANGRTATCLLNIFLRAMDYPSILLRHPAENEDPSSLYSRAIASIDESRALLIQLIKARITDAILQPYVDESLKEVIHYRVILSNVYQEINASFPSFDIDKHWDASLASVPEEMLTGEGGPISGFQMLIDEATAVKATLTEQKAHNQSFHQPKFTKSQQELLLLKLKEVSNVDEGWKAYKQGSIILLEHPVHDKIKNIAKLLNDSGSCKAATCVRVDTQMSVVKVTGIDLTKLLALPTMSASKRSEVDNRLIIS